MTVQHIILQALYEEERDHEILNTMFTLWRQFLDSTDLEVTVGTPEIVSMVSLKNNTNTTLVIHADPTTPETKVRPQCRIQRNDRKNRHRKLRMLSPISCE